MPYTRVTRAACGADAIAYLRGHGRGHNGAAERNVLVAAVNMVPVESEFVPAMQRYWNRADPRHKIQLDRFVISFHPEELDANAPEDCLKAAEIGCELARRIAPHSQAAVFVQRDGVGGKLHVHVAVNDVRMDNYKGIDKSAYFFWTFAPIANEICAQYFKLKATEPAPERVTQAVRAKRIENKLIRAANDEELRRAAEEGREPQLGKTIYIWQDDLRSRIRRAADGAADEEDFAHRLRLDGVELVARERKDGSLSYRRHATKTHPEHYTYELVDLSGFDGEPPRKLRSRSYKLGADFQPDAIAKLFQPQAKAARTSQEPAIKLPEVPLRKPAKAPEKTIGKEETMAKEKPQEKQTSREMEQAMAMAKRIAFPEYVRLMGWEAVDAKDPDYMNEMMQRMDLFLYEWDIFVRWRADRLTELKKNGGKLEPVLKKDKTTGEISVIKANLLKQFAGYLGWLAAEQRRQKAEKQYESLVAEYERADKDGKDYDD